MQRNFLAARTLTRLAVGLALAGCGDDDAADDGADSSASDPTTSATIDPTTSEGPGSSEGETTAGTMPTTADASSDGADSSEDGGSESTGVAPTGDVWVDAEGTVVGRYRATFDFYDEAIEGLVTLDATEAVWGVAEDHASIRAIEPGVAYYTTSDCSGDEIYIASEYSEAFRPDIVSWAPTFSGVDIYFVVAEGFVPVAFEPSSHYELAYGCIPDDPGDVVPTEYYPVAEVTVVTMPVFAPPLAIETH